MKTLILFLLLSPVIIYAQFDSLIFSKGMRLNFEYKNIYPLGDQNQDGFDDIMLYDCNEKRGDIYFGGNPMDTIPDNSIQFFDSIYTNGQIGIIDINDDGINDIIMTTVRYLSDIGFYTVGPLRVYYGGSRIDSIPTFTFNAPQGTKGFSAIYILKDFNGDGRDEFVVYDGNLPFSEKQYGTLYFYNTENQFDTIPHYVLMGDSVKKISIGFDSSGDINGDGKADFTGTGVIGEQPPYDRYFRSFYIGNENFDLEADETFYQDEHSFNLTMSIINDINRDGNDDILIDNYGNFYPWYYMNSILYGSFPIDTIPSVGLNTQAVAIDYNSITETGDVNGDGFNDLFVRMAGLGYPNVKLWLGGPDMPGTLDDVAHKTWFGTSSGFGRIIGTVGDVDGDGVNDIAIGQILYGEQPSAYCNDAWVYIFRGDTSVVTYINHESVNLPEFYRIEDPYPNPFNPSTKIKYTLAVRAKVTIKLFDSLGREIKTLLNEEKPKGEYETEINLQNLSSGTYFVQFRFTDGRNRSFTETKKIVLTK